MLPPPDVATSAYSTISFLTDYGLVDEFVGVVKGVIRQLAPETVVIDISHDVVAHDIRAGSLTLTRAVQYLPDGIVLAIVDPGVGTPRRAIAVEVSNESCHLVFVGPDNGLMAPAVAMAGGATRAYELSNEELHLAAPGATFAGRDVFAPVAARLSAGLDLALVGTSIDPNTLLPGVLPLSRSEDGELQGEVLWVDRFGNAQINIDPAEVEPFGDVVTLRFGSTSRTARVTRTYGDLKAGEIGLVIDSYGLLSISLDRRPASTDLGIAEGMAVTICDADTPPMGSPPLGSAPLGSVSQSTPITLGRRPAE
jgi:S-adenosyl-L-methionine hydrolase (adenosine-forming)